MYRLQGVKVESISGGFFVEVKMIKGLFRKKFKLMSFLVNDEKSLECLIFHLALGLGYER